MKSPCEKGMRLETSTERLQHGIKIRHTLRNTCENKTCAHKCKLKLCHALHINDICGPWTDLNVTSIGPEMSDTIHLVIHGAPAYKQFENGLPVLIFILRYTLVNK